MIPSQSSFCLTVSDSGGDRRTSTGGFEGTTVRLAEDFLAMIYPGETGLDLNCDVHERIIFALFVTIYGEKTISAV
jgi:hypothetical protein